MCTRKLTNRSSDDVGTTCNDEDPFANQESNRTDFNKKRIEHYVEEENRLLNDLREIVGFSTTTKCLLSNADVRAGGHGSGSALLISMWHLTNFLFHLRRENDHLRKQVQCMDEMRKVERLQSELLQTACACATAGQSGNIATSLDAESGYEASSCSQPGDTGSQLFSASSKWAGCSSTVEALASLEPLRKNSQVKTSSLVSPSSSPRRPHLASLLQSTLDDGKKQRRSTSTNDDFLGHSMEPVRKDSDEPIFTEVLLPNYGSKRQSGAKRHSAFRMSHISTTSSTAYYTPVSLPDTSTPSRVGRLLERFGFKKGGMRRLALSSPLTITTTGENMNYGINEKPQSLLRDPSRKATRCEDSVAAAPKLLCTRKVFQKKRKRKISESDSWPSSDATGKLSSMVEIPEKFELPSDQRGPSYDRKTLARREASNGIGAGQAVSSVEKKQSDRLRVEEIAEPKESTSQKLKSSDAETNTFFERRLLTTGQNSATDRLRPVSLLDANCMFGNSASETDIDHLSLQYKDEQSPSSRLSLLVDDHRYFDEHSVLESILLPTNSKRSDVKEAEKLSISPSQMTVSNDSVFTSHETDLNGCVSGINVLKQLLALQEKNSILIRQLREKTNEYESIVERVANLEESMRMLRNRLRFNNFLDTICRKSAKRQYITAEAANALEAQIKRMEQSMKELKADSYRSQQAALQAEAKQQTINQRYVEKIEALQAVNRELIGQITHGSKTSSTGEHSEKNYDGLFKFTVNLLQKMHRLKRKLNEIHYACSNRNVELLQTQSSLLLAHAQIERQKGELRELNSKTKRLKRAQTYHGQDLLQKKVNAELSFYLPFKLYGSQLTKVERCPSEFSIHMPDETLETEFISFIEPAKHTFLPEPKPRAVPDSENVKPAFTGAASLIASTRDTKDVASDGPKLSATTSALSHRQPEDHSSENTATKGIFQSTGIRPVGKGRSPSLQRLTKVGHVKALAATFDANEAPKMQGKSDSTSALPHYSYGLFYCPEQQMPKMTPAVERQYHPAMTTKGKGSQSKPSSSGKAKIHPKRPSSDQFDSSAESYRETEYETMVYQMSMRPVPISVVPPSQRGRAVQQLPTRVRPTAVQRKTSAEKSLPTSDPTPIRPVVCIAKPSCIPQRTVTAMARKSAQKEQSAHTSSLKTPKISDNQQAKGESGAQQTRTSWLQKLRRRV